MYRHRDSVFFPSFILQYFSIVLCFVSRIHNNASVQVSSGILASVDSLDWGRLSPNDTKLFDVTFTNTASYTVSLVITNTNWVADPPKTLDYLTFSSNYTGESLSPNGSILIEFSLFVDPSVSWNSTFTFDIIVSSVQSS